MKQRIMTISILILVLALFGCTEDGIITPGDLNGDKYHDKDMQILEEIVALNNLDVESAKDIAGWNFFEYPLRAWRLDLEGRGVTELPSSMVELTELQRIKAAFNSLTSLPHNIGESTKLLYLDIENNSISELPSSFASLDSLETLNISSNLLEVVPSQLEHLENLKYVDLSGNQLYCTGGVQDSSQIPDYIFDNSIGYVLGVFEQNCGD
ncbi:MAG: leucine-rich repeat domain-containing protein [FCB group bacterium]|nr:leucine-rich repeat domain-containing protein [FCB group bacterium]